MTTQQKINLALLGALLVVGFLLYWGHVQDGRRDERVERVGLSAAKAQAVDSATRARLRPFMDSVNGVLMRLDSEQKNIKSSILLNSRKNENLNKQIDSLNGRLGVRPRF